MANQLEDISNLELSFERYVIRNWLQAPKLDINISSSILRIG